MSRRLIIRADGGVEIGFGHIMRCLAIADAAVAKGWEIGLASADMPPDLLQKIPSYCAIYSRPGRVGETSWLSEVLANGDEQVLLIDGHHFDSPQRKAWCKFDCPVATIDDNCHLTAYHTDLLVNPNRHASMLDYYQDQTIGELLLGVKYFPLRSALRKALDRPLPALSNRHRVLVNFGGSDPTLLTMPVSLALRRVLPAEVAIDIVIGPGHPESGQLIARLTREVANSAVYVDPANFGQLMANAGLAISAGGGTVLELAAFATPTLTVIVADNQDLPARASGYPFVDGRSDNKVTEIAAMAAKLWADNNTRQQLSTDLADDIDGQGAARIIEKLEMFFD
jgi:UDP-2,4-diacetamido-2,4,6-trideoxy-beta-L-altropyranose hydrolase